MNKANDFYVAGLQFGIASDEQTEAASVAECSHSTTSDRFHTNGTIHDGALGVTNRSTACKTCHSSLNDCPGHPGLTDLWRPVPNPFFADCHLAIAKVLCFTCGQLILCPDAQTKAEILKLPKHKRLAEIARRSKGIPYCGSYQQRTQIEAEKKAGTKQQEQKEEKTRDTIHDDNEDDENEEKEETEEKEEKDDKGDEDEDDDVLVPTADEDDENQDLDVLSQGSGSDHDLSDDLTDVEDPDDGDGKPKKKKKKKKITTKAKTPKTKGQKRKATGALRNPHPKKRHLRRFEGEFDVTKLLSQGCGAPTVEYTRKDGLSLHAKYKIIWKGSISKKNWPIHTQWKMYNVLQTVSPETQELLGYDWKLSAIRGLMNTKVHIPPSAIRRKKDEGGSKSNNDNNSSNTSCHASDDNTAELKEFTSKIKKHLTRTIEEGIRTQEQYPEELTSYSWVFPATGKTLDCDCSEPIDEKKESKKEQKKQYNPAYCICLQRALLDNTLTIDDLQLHGKPPYTMDHYVSMHSELTKLSMQSQTQSQSPSTTTTTTTHHEQKDDSKKLRRTSTKTLKTLATDAENAYITYIVGEINKKGAGRRAQKTAQTSWMAGASQQNAAQKKERCWCGRLIGKRGRIRGTMYGKRCNKTARTVASGSVYLSLKQIGIPPQIARQLTVHQVVQEYNLAMIVDQIRLREVEFEKTTQGDLYNMNLKNRDRYVPSLSSTCERHMQNMDWVIYNRQPSLHKPSIQGSHAKLLRKVRYIMDRRTFASNQSMTTGFNLDYDGDELNVHLPEDVMSSTESKYVMSAPQQIRHQQGDCVIIGLVQNSRVALMRLTHPLTMFTKDEFYQLLCQFGEQDYPPYEKAMSTVLQPDLPFDKYSGKLLISTLLPERVNYAPQNRKKKYPPAVIVNSVLTSGILSGEDVAPGVSGNLVHVMVQDVGQDLTATFLSGIQRVLNYYIMKVGQSMSMHDYMMSAETERQCKENLLKAFDEIEKFTGNYDMRRPNVEEKTIQELLELAKKRNTDLYTKDLESRLWPQYGIRNGITDLTESSSKGKPAFALSLGCVVGQQMPQNGRVVANVAHFHRTFDDPEAHGFVSQCYAEGVSPWSYFASAISGRESIVNIHASVPTVGYFQNRLGRSLADFYARHDGTIRDSSGNIVQFRYGGDAMDATNMESNPVRFLTPYEYASEDLRTIRSLLLETRRLLYKTSRFMPDKFLGPMNTERILLTASRLERTDERQKEPCLTSEEASRYVAEWFTQMEHGRLLITDRKHFQYNLLLDVLLKDALSAWCICDRFKLTKTQLDYALNQFQMHLARARITPGEAVGPIASQSMGEPATQMTLNVFHTSGGANTIAQPITQMNNVVNAGKKPSNAAMYVFLKPEWTHTWLPGEQGDPQKEKFAKIVAESLVERNLFWFLSDAIVCNPKQFSKRDAEWTTQTFERLDKTSQRLFEKYPCMRVEFQSWKCKASRLSMLEIACKIMDLSKRKFLMMHDNESVLYITYDEERDHSNIDHISTCLESDVKDVLKETMIRGLPSILSASVIKFPSKSKMNILQDTNDKDKRSLLQIQETFEWAIVTQGANFSGLLTVPAVDFPRCECTHMHHVYKLMGIQSLNNWLLRTMEELVRSCDSKVDIRHPQLIADVMTRPGTITPMTRNGLLNSTNSPCRLLFENVLENIKMFAAYSARDNLQGVPECILMGNLAPVGTGFSSGVFFASDKCDQKQVYAVQPYARQVPCQAPSFRFFQQWVPMNREGKYYKMEYGALVVSRLPQRGEEVKENSVQSKQPTPTLRTTKHVRYDQNAVPYVMQLLQNRTTTSQKVRSKTEWNAWKPWSMSIMIQVQEQGKLLITRC